MIYQRDWLMRQIEAMVSAILRFLLHTSAAEETTEAQTLQEQIQEAIRSQGLCRTEDRILENADGDDPVWLKRAVYFYSEINKLPDAELEANNFSREEIHSGLIEIIRQYGFDGIL